MKAGK